MDTVECGIPSRRPARSRAESDALLLGERVAHEWRIERVIGKGGMGVVYAATHERTGEAAAIKVLADIHLRDPRTVARFAREMRVAMKLGSPHTTRVLSVGRLPSGEPMMVMELLDGEDLGAVVKRRRGISVEEVVSWLLATCDAVGEAHDAGFVHRDIKLANIFLARRPGGGSIVKVLDFGLAKAVARESDDASLTEAGTVLGTPHYMAPEMYEPGRAIDARADVWALGVCLYRLLTNALPFEALSVMGLFAQIMTGHIVPPSKLRPDLPKDVEAVIMRCLARDPSERFADARALARALERCRVRHRKTQSFTRLFAAVPMECAPPPSSGPSELPTAIETPRKKADSSPPPAEIVEIIAPIAPQRTTARWVAAVAAPIASPLPPPSQPRPTLPSSSSFITESRALTVSARKRPAVWPRLLAVGVGVALAGAAAAAVLFHHVP